MLHQLFEISPRLVGRIVHFLETIQPQQVGQFVSIDAITLVAIFGDPGVVAWMRADHALDPRRNDAAGPRC
jgi:hypothetical protein